MPPIPPEAAIRYMQSKRDFERYQMDMLWAMAHNKAYNAYPRYDEYLLSQKPQITRQVQVKTEQDVIDMFKNAGRKGAAK